MQRNSSFPASYQSQLMKHSLMKHIQYSHKHHHSVPPTVLNSINTVGTKSVYVCMCETTYSVKSFKGTSDSIAICNLIKFNIKIHTTNSHKINFTMSIFN